MRLLRRASLLIPGPPRTLPLEAGENGSSRKIILPGLLVGHHRSDHQGPGD